ncbi:MAG: C4-type zinc ribbon domain-containing protein [Verrucomicrobia bacterium]|nr:C4-type zinc ribbon domain-containing protein [Verrucomicrobiota bacterium]
MLQVIKNLLALQERDRKLMRVREELSRIPPERESLLTQAGATQTNLEACRLRARQIESGRKELELEVEAQKQMIQRYAGQQLQTRKNEEYRALAHEIEACEQHISGVEDRILGLMEEADQVRTATAVASREALETKQTVEKELAELARREAEHGRELAALEAGRTELAALVDAAALHRYERLLKSKGGQVVVDIRHGVCGGCHMTLQRQNVVSCQADQELVGCPNCGRILYFTPDMDTSVLE